MFDDGLTAVILVGGFGTRIRHVIGSTPKPLAIVNGKPFLHWVLKNLQQYKIKKIYLLTHYGSHHFDRYVENEIDDSLNVRCIHEALPSGTGGSVMDFLSLREKISKPFLLLNGDSLLLGADIAGAIERMVRDNADGAIFGLEIDDASRYGTIRHNKNMELVGFDEKKAGRGLINTGVYLLNPDLLNSYRQHHRPLSIEKEVFPQIIVDNRKILIEKDGGSFIDIGTEESLSEATNFIKNNFNKIDKKNERIK